MKSLMTSRRTLIKATAFSGLAAAIDKTIPIGLKMLKLPGRQLKLKPLPAVIQKS